VPTLLETQTAMRESLVRGDRAAIAAMLATGVAADRLDIYRNTFLVTLTKALQLGFPAVRKLVGEDFFEATAQLFIAQNPPRAAWLDVYGEAYPDFLETLPQAASVPYLADVARLEWAVSRALHAADIDRLDPARLASVAPEDCGRIRLMAEPSIGLLHLHHPADAIWRAVLGGDDAALGAINPGSGEVLLLIERQRDGVNFERLPNEDWRFLTGLCAGQPIDAAIDPASDFDAAGALAEHLAKGRFTGFDLAPASQETGP
jgi:Putative DNA-binding domain